MSSEDRRAPGAMRTPFDGLVEVGGALGPAWEAQAVDLSEEGIHLRTAYLPELGQPLTCRFDAGKGKSVLVAGEVVWSKSESKGGEFGVRFTEMDAESVESLKRMCGIGGKLPEVQTGSKVRLHIEGLASPMRAKIKDARPTAVTVGSELGFLQVGKQLELEDAQSGGKRPACIDRVDVAVDPSSHVPQLVVTLRYADVPADAGTQAAPDEGPSKTDTRQASASSARPPDDMAAIEEASKQMKGALARQIGRVGPALERFVRRAKTTAALMMERKRAEDLGPARPRTTSMPPGGGLHASGRKVVRGDSSPAIQTDKGGTPSRLISTKGKVIVAGAVMTASVAGALVLKKAHQEGATMAEAKPTTAPGAGIDSNAVAPALNGPAQPPAPAPAESTPPFAPPQPQPQSAALAAADEPLDTAGGHSHKKHPKVAPFSNGPVHHANVLHIKMDGPIESIEGAQQPTGFAVKIPGRKSLEAAAPLAARDSRIAAIKVSNDTAGAQLTVNFKDGVPNYAVSAKDDTLVIALAPVGAPDKVANDRLANKDDKGAKSAKHSRHENTDKEKARP
jgi:hypothetical protein